MRYPLARIRIVSVRARACSTLPAAVTVLCVVLSANCFSSIRGGDGVGQLQSEARNTGPFVSPSHWQPQNQNTSQPSSNNQLDCCDDDDGYDLEALGVITFGAVLIASAPFWGPATLVGDDYDSAGFYPRYPYQRPHEGYLMIEPDLPRRPREWAGRGYVEYGGDFGDVTTWNGGLLLETTSRFGIDASAHYYSEQVSIGNTDNVSVGDANLVFRFAQSPNLQVRTGVGFNWLDDSLGSDFGFNFTYGGDWFPIRPFIVSSELDWGEIGHASLFHARITTGVQWHRAEVYAGYDYLDVGNAQLDTWVAGLRFWF